MNIITCAGCDDPKSFVKRSSCSNCSMDMCPNCSISCDKCNSSYCVYCYDDCQSLFSRTLVVRKNKSSVTTSIKYICYICYNTKISNK